MNSAPAPEPCNQGNKLQVVSKQPANLHNQQMVAHFRSLRHNNKQRFEQRTRSNRASQHPSTHHGGPSLHCAARNLHHLPPAGPLRPLEARQTRARRLALPAAPLLCAYCRSSCHYPPGHKHRPCGYDLEQHRARTLAPLECWDLA